MQFKQAVRTGAGLRGLCVGLAMAFALSSAWAQASGSSPRPRAESASDGPKSAQRSEPRKKAATRQAANRPAAQRNAKAVGPQGARSQARASQQRVVAARPTHAQLAGLRDSDDPLSLKSSVVLVVDQDTREVLLSKNDSAVLPIASITKLMTGLLVSEARLPLDEMITITQDDIDTERERRRAWPLARRSAVVSCCTWRSCPARTALPMRLAAPIRAAWPASCG